jgi:agmatine deiminase
VLKENELILTELPCAMKEGQKTANELYINYLHVDNLVVVPQFGLNEDNDAFRTIQDELGKSNTVVPFQAKVIAEDGGVLNCVSWTIKE